MLKNHPFNSEDQLFNLAERLWHQCNKKDWLEAFSRHPSLGVVKTHRKKLTPAAAIAAKEQEGTVNASKEILEELALSNKAYKKKFGFIYILCATGKSAKVMLSILRIRLNNDRGTELIMSMVEQSKITKLRLQKLLS